MYSLIINTTEESDRVDLVSKNKTLSKTGDSSLQLIHFLLSNHSVKQSDLDAIQVERGPGNRFTQTRIGVVTANALAFALNLLVNGKTFETPIYHQEPNITQPK